MLLQKLVHPNAHMVRVAQCNIKLTSPLVERAISQDDEQSQVRGTPPKVIGRKRVQETNQCTAAQLMGPRASAAVTVPPPSLHGVNRVGFWGREMRVMFAVHRNECLEFYTLVAT